MGFTRFVTSGFSACLIAALAIGCSQGSDIQLQGSKPSPPGLPATPGDQTGFPVDHPTAPKDPSTETPGPGTAPPKSTTIRYRMLCDDHYPPFLNAISSLASPSGFGAGLQAGEADASGKFDPVVDRNLESHAFPQIVRIPRVAEARILFSARRVRKSPASNGNARFIFVSDVDIVRRGGIAKEVSREVIINTAAQRAADLEALGIRSFGASDEGRYLLIGTKAGYELRDSVTLAILGVIKTGSANENFNPALRESDMIFSVSSAKGSTFETRLFSLGLAINGTLNTSNLVTVQIGLRRPLVAISKAAGDAFAAINSSNQIVAASPLKRAGAVSMVRIAQLPAKGRLSSAAAFWRDAVSGETRAAIAFENIGQTVESSSARYKIEQVFIRVVNVDETTLSAAAITPDFDYPLEVRHTIESGIGIGLVPGVSELKTSPDGKAIFGLFSGSLSKQVYRLGALGLDRVSQESCSNLSIGVEP